MIKGNDVLAMLRPNGGWIMRGNEYEGITFVECEPLTKEDFEAGFAQYETWKAEQDAAVLATKAAAEAKLAVLGLTTDDLKALGLN